jgi:hypothetical protein
VNNKEQAMSKDRVYRGRGQEEITDLCQKMGGTVLGEIQRNTGDAVATVEFSLVNGELHLTVDGEQYTSITNALHELAPEIATNAADGSEGSGNVANNVIGNYAILKHVILEGQSMWEILGGDSHKKPRKTTPTAAKKARTVISDPSQTPAPGNLYNWFPRDQIVEIARQMGGAEQFQAAIQGKTVKQFADQFGLPV